ncbi:MAG: hypothetical protein RRY95_08155 [Oscillospiraceae bacterium]
MTTFLACSLAAISAAAFLALWFWVVRRELYAKQKAAHAARCQLIAGKQAYMRARDGPRERQAQAIMERSQRIYDQSIQLYNELLHKPWNRLPGRLMGFYSMTQHTRG